MRDSGLRVTGFQVLRDFEGLSGRLHAYKVDIAKAMLRVCQSLGAKVLLVCSSTSTHASGDPELLVRDLRKLAMLAVPLGIRIAYEALSWGRHVNEYPKGWEIVEAADHPNLGVGLDSFHVLATDTALDALELVDPAKIFLVQLADFMWQEIRSPEERINTARHFRVFPGEGAHSARGGDAGAPPRRDGVPRGLQLRGVQRRLRAAAARGRRGARPLVGQMAHRPGTAAQPSGAAGAAAIRGNPRRLRLAMMNGRMITAA